MHKKNKLIYSFPVDIERVAIEKPKVEFWHKHEIDFFLNGIKDDYLYTPILITVLTGLRIGELCGLRWCDINLDNGILSVTHQVINDKVSKSLLFTDKLKTLTSYRKITIPKVLINHLTDIKGKALDTDFVVLSRHGLMCNPRNLSMNFTKKISKYQLPLDELSQDHP